MIIPPSVAPNIAMVAVVAVMKIIHHVFARTVYSNIFLVHVRIQNGSWKEKNGIWKLKEKILSNKVRKKRIAIQTKRETIMVGN
jgi:hypothetical protein